ncbi:MULTISPECIES: FRG domain-containing protein [unclassified Halomonas]|uniref:FRG domain-containing protein n=1 Tax=unclassified Halomonas TaxID=2609666 RepID=UPI0020766F1A|nr:MULTISPECIES: FRG domain-containing protein [unclassified Halomonas]
MSYETEDFTCARELMEYLSPLHEGRWGRYRIFRGHGSEKFKLSPSVFRKSPSLPSNELSEDQIARHVYFELAILDTFLDGCDASGISVPADTPALRSKLSERHMDVTLFNQFEGWPHHDTFPLLATAQHHGVLTCLLDWTKRSYVAAYFAASQALRELDSANLSDCAMKRPKELVIWSLSTINNQKWKLVKYVEAQGFVSVNRAAQDGVFTATSLEAIKQNGIEGASLENIEEMYRVSHTGRSRLGRYSLPISEAAHLLELCAAFGVKGSTLFPGYEGVGREVEDLRIARQYRAY